MIKSGKLDRRLVFLTKETVTNEYNEREETWTETATTWAERLEVRFTDANKAALANREADARVRIRYRKGVEVGQRVRLDGSPYLISSIDEQDRRATLVLTLAGLLS